MPVWSVSAFIRYAMAGMDWPGMDLQARKLVLHSLIRQAAHNLPIMPSGRSVLRDLRAAGYGMRTETFIKAYTSKSREEGMLADQRARDPGTVQFRANMPVFDGILQGEYMYQVSMNVFTQSGEGPWGRKTFNYSSNQLLSPNDVIGAYYADFEDLPEFSDADWESMQFEGAFRSY